MSENHEHKVIAHLGTHKLLAAKGKNPRAGDQVIFYDFGHTPPGDYSTYWEVNNVPGGQQIVLQNDPTLAISIRGNNANGSVLELAPASSGESINPNQLWSTADLPTIISLSGHFLAMDSDGINQQPQVWDPLQNDHQKWKIDTFAAIKALAKK
jgi:hypothetical protein